jgi:hypothetical protein
LQRRAGAEGRLGCHRYAARLRADYSSERRKRRRARAPEQRRVGDERRVDQRFVERRTCELDERIGFGERRLSVRQLSIELRGQRHVPTEV